MEQHKVYALEGLDGAGKTTTAQMLAEQSGGMYLYCMDGNKMKPYRKMFDNAPIPLRFLYYLAVSFDTFNQAEQLRRYGNVFIDRAIASTVTYHKAFGLPDSWLELIPRVMLDQIDTMIYLTVMEEERRRRLDIRSATPGTMTISDDNSFLVADRIDKEYRDFCPDKTLIVSTDEKSLLSVVNEIRKSINV